MTDTPKAGREIIPKTSRGTPVMTGYAIYALLAEDETYLLAEDGTKLLFTDATTVSVGGIVSRPAEPIPIARVLNGGRKDFPKE